MAVELAAARAIAKPWGVSNHETCTSVFTDTPVIGEIAYDRPLGSTANDTLLFKMLFTAEPLSIQVHPNDAYSQLMGLPNGKTEAWYIVKAAPNAKIALGLRRTLTSSELRQAIADGSIANCVDWRSVMAGDVISVPAGTIHAIGAGLIIAEIQQRSDATFRLFDHGRTRALHIDDAVAMATPGPAAPDSKPKALTAQRSLLVANAHFAFERIALARGTTWHLNADCETWLLALEGRARIGALSVVAGDAVLAQADATAISVSDDGLVALVAYPGPDPIPHLLERWLPHLVSSGVRQPDRWEDGTMTTLERNARTGAPL